MKRSTKYIVANPPGSLFAKKLQTALREEGVETKRISSQRAEVKAGKKFALPSHGLDKIEQFKRFKAHGIASPAFCLRAEDIGTLGSKEVFARTLINSTGGQGIIEFSADDQQPPRAPLYTAYVPKKAEFRVHVVGDKVIDVQQKKKREGHEGGNARIRNLANGYVYCRNDVHPPEGIGDLAVAAVKALDYGHGAVDIIYNEKQNQCYVLEVNSRPGIEGTTMKKYAEAVKEILE